MAAQIFIFALFSGFALVMGAMSWLLLVDIREECETFVGKVVVSTCGLFMLGFTGWIVGWWVTLTIAIQNHAL